ncbi:crosslink repair DNA glycosylase YcaQ family protein [Salinibacterium sp. G-O1]|uniref:DNA glycosylase AlkZ-like family protein n=1 Tax=Salinibacterium sp. G-O1 TaxID=3046208 RepID=UPI0024B97354|nr:crosslink repair DNA glycosylase YcaQ family protein [Salinibacterium sp. G-O1]MDJ0335635.1 crosslink repair DNA glycosylase YcaQ family protein [Salinibacterium sp. G-O1]
MTHQLTRDEARRIAVRAQLLDADRPGDVVEVAEQLGAIKIDPTATIAPAQHTILWSRIGLGYEPIQLSKNVEADRLLFEFDGSFLPISLLPLMLPAMRRWPQRESHRDWLEANDSFRTDVLARLRSDGPLLASGIPDTAKVARPTSDGWYGPGQVVHMLDFLMRQGEVAIVGREGRHRLWDLAERVYPQNLPEYSLEEAEWMLNERRLQAAGIAKRNSRWTPVGDAGEPATIEGSEWSYRVDPGAIAALDDDPGGRVAFLNPYDGMLFDRPRLKEIFEFEYVLEQFKPKAQRKYGFFAHPILMGDRFVGLLDATVFKEVLTVNAVHQFLPFDAEEDEMVRAEIAELGEWLGVTVSAW